MIDPSVLMTGPRGRRLLLAFALESQRAAFPNDQEWRLHRAVADASYVRSPGRGTSVVRIGIGESPDADGPSAPTSETVANLLATVPLSEPTPHALRNALAISVDAARYWQEPDGEDILAATPPVKAALERIADHIAVSPHAAWWCAGVDLHDQWALQWQIEHALQATANARSTIEEWHQQVPDIETRALRDRPADPAANWSGEWWSIPPVRLAHSARSLFDGSPAGVWWAEDAGGFREVKAQRIDVPSDVRVLEINGPDDWSDLCRRFPLDVSGQKRHDWYRATGRHGRWIMPDWYAVARNYDGVHLTVSGYLSAAGIVMPVDDTTASVIAGWNPDETWWFIDPVWTSETTSWILDHHGNGWERRSSPTME